LKFVDVAESNVEIKNKISECKNSNKNV